MKQKNSLNTGLQWSRKVQDEILENYNAKLISLFLFQYSILIPMMIFANATILIGSFSALILIIAVAVNRRFYFNPKIVLFAIIVLFLILVKTFLFHDGGYSVLVSFFTIACPALYIISLPFNKHIFLESCYKLAIISFFLLLWVPLSPVDINYMRFGYGMAPVTVILYYRLANCRNCSKKNIVFSSTIFLISLIEIIVFGARGSIIPVIIMIALDKLVINKINFKIVPLIMLAIISYFNINNIVDYFYNMLKAINVRSYSLIKIRQQLAKGFESASSGRDVIYSDAINNIKQNIVFGGDLIGGVGDTYTHNIFLQITEEFGIIAIIIFVGFLLKCIIKLHNTMIQKNDRLVLAVFLSLSMGRLLFSSSYWSRPEFWLFVGFGIILNNKIPMRNRGNE